MEYGICLLPVVPLRKEPNDRSEMMTQVLFGETLRVFDSNQKWLSIETDLDNYPGWIDDKQVVPISFEEYERVRSSTQFLTIDAFNKITQEHGDPMLIPACCSLPGLESRRLQLASRVYGFDGIARQYGPVSAEGIIRVARSFINAPYLWGGKTLMGIDCSGLTQVAYRLNGIDIPRDANQQSAAGETINLLSEARPADLAFFDDSEGRIVHVGIIIDPHTIIHASGRVRVDTLDHQGIYREETRNYSHQLRLIRRII